MNQSLTLSAAMVTMTSREIAELAGKEHKHVLTDIRGMLEGLGLRSADFSADLPDGYGRAQPAFQLPKRETLILVSGYSVAMRAKIIDRWQELEESAGVSIPQTMAAALRLAADQAEALEAAHQKLAIAAPKVDFVDRYVQAEGLKGFREVAKLLKANEARFTEFLLDRGIMYRLAGKLTASAPHLNAGRFELRTGVADHNGHAFTTSKFTPKGIDWVAGEWAKYQLRDGEAA